MIRFLYFYLRSMRLYYGFVTGTAVLAGCMARHGSRLHIPWGWRDVAVILIGYMAWGVNQIFSDWLDRKEDAVNAPHRPMVTGELAARPALILSGSLMALFAVTAYLISPVSLAVLLAGGLLNVLYSLLKKIPVINTLIYGLAMTCCTVFGVSRDLDIQHFCLFSGVLMPFVLPSHVLMCHNSYFKDIEGDRAAGLRTLPVLFPRFSLWLGMILSGGWTLLLSGFCVWVFACSQPTTEAGPWLMICGYVLLMLYLTFQLFRAFWKKDHHAATRLNCQLCVTWLWGIMISASPYWLIGMFASVLLIEILYRWYPDEKE